MLRFVKNICTRATVLSTLLLAAVSAVLGLTIATAVAQDADRTIDLGIAVRGDDANLLIAAEQDLGRSVDVVRTFALWDDNFPTADDRVALNGRDLIFSINPQTAAGPIPWADIAAAQPGDPLHDDMVDWANRLKPYEDQLWLTFNHEPETVENIVHGTDQEFIAAWRNFMTVMADSGLEPIGRAWIMTDFAFELGEQDRRHPDRWYPGDEWVEAAAADAYNWYDCRRRVDIPWRGLDQIIGDFVEWGLDHPDEQLMLAEMGSAEDPLDPNRKAEWLAEALELLATPEYSQITTVSHFSLIDTIDGNFCDWQINSSPTTQQAMADFANSSLFGGDTAAPPGTIPIERPDFDPTAPCIGTEDATGVTLTWDGVGFPAILRNGAWITTIGFGETEFFDPNPPVQSFYEVRLHNNGRTDLRCSIGVADPDPVDPDPVDPDPVDPAPVDPDPAAVCQVVVNPNGGTTVEWSIPNNTINVLRNGFWIGTVTNGNDFLNDPLGNQNDTYFIRVRPAGQVVDYDCTAPVDPAPVDPAPVDPAPVDPGPPAVCQLVVNPNGGTTVEWTIPNNTINVLRNGFWIGTVTNGNDFLNDPLGNQNDTYFIRVRPAGQIIDYDCEPAA